MAMPLSATFDYVAVVPDSITEGAFECAARAREPVAWEGNQLRDRRLVGVAPWLRVADAGLTPNAGSRRPRVLRSCFTLTATEHRQATTDSTEFHIDKAVAASLRPGDVLHVARTSRGGVGLSVVRGDELVVAVGVVTAVPLGRNVLARIPYDLVAVAEAVFRQRDPDFELPEHPVEIQADDACAVFYRGQRTLARYAVYLDQPVTDGVPGTDECAAICRKGSCPVEAANASALLLAAGGLPLPLLY
jgi:hypothetical protein